MAVLKSAERVSVKELPDGGIVVEVEPGPRNIWKVPLLCIVLGAIGIVAGYLLHIYNPGLPEGYEWRGAWRIMGMGALVLAAGPVSLLILVMQGPPKKATLEATPGHLRAERSIAGDRVVSSYGVSEVQCLFVDDAALFATTRKGDQHLLGFGKREVKAAIATLLASRLWHGEELECGAAPMRWVILPRVPPGKVEPVAT
jgi:hypothetical protein